MKNTLFTLLLFFFALSSFAQKECKIIYKINVTEDLFDESSPDMDGYAKKFNFALKNHASNFNFLLKIKGDESYFESIKTMSNDNDNMNYKLASAIVQPNSNYYLNLTTKEKLKEIKAFGKNYIVQDSIDHWEITKEKKVIGNYVCYKAITKKVTINDKGTFTRDIVAWFTTELPFSFGPKGYGGLPGLILELDDRVIKYTLHSINYVNNLKLSKPKDGKLVTEKELLEIQVQQSNEN